MDGNYTSGEQKGKQGFYFENRKWIKMGKKAKLIKRKTSYISGKLGDVLLEIVIHGVFENKCETTDGSRHGNGQMLLGSIFISLTLKHLFSLVIMTWL